MHCLAVFCVSL